MCVCAHVRENLIGKPGLLVSRITILLLPLSRLSFSISETVGAGKEKKCACDEGEDFVKLLKYNILWSL